VPVTTTDCAPDRATVKFFASSRRNARSRRRDDTLAARSFQRTLEADRDRDQLVSRRRFSGLAGGRSESSIRSVRRHGAAGALRDASAIIDRLTRGGPERVDEQLQFLADLLGLGDELGRLRSIDGLSHVSSSYKNAGGVADVASDPHSSRTCRIAADSSPNAGPRIASPSLHAEKYLFPSGPGHAG
jgi:hypothetical protein